MRIGELSSRSGVSQRSLRYYEQHGLIEASRESNGYRDYGDAVVDRARTIHLLFDMGFARELVHSVLSCTGVATQAAHDDLAARLTVARDQLDARITHLTTTRGQINEFLSTR